jgi:hypothetical protein
MATDIQEAFEKSIAELGFESLLNDSPVSPGEVEEQEPSEETEAEFSEDDEADAEEAEAPDDETAVSDDDDEDDENSPLIELSENAKLKLPDGTVVDASQAVLLQADYTRKTQELAEQRKAYESEQAKVAELKTEYEQAYGQMREWYESRAQRPSDWMAEIASQAQDPTAVVAQAIYTMAQNNMLDPKFVETFGIESGPVAEVAKSSHVESELEELKRWRREQEVSVQREQQVKQRAASYEREWESIKASRGVQFADKADEFSAKQELLQFALQNNLTRSLTDAYDLMTVRKPKPVSMKPQPDAEVTAKKRASRAVTPKSAGTAKPVKKVVSDRDAILAVLEEQGL